MYNPFEFRSVATGDRFIDRRIEIKTLRECIKSGQNVTLYSPRRFGKSSLILECFRRLGKDFITVYLDFYKVNNISDLAEKIIEATASAAYKKSELLVKDMKDFFKSLRPVVNITSEGIAISIKGFDIERDLEEAFRFPQLVAEKKKRRLVFAMDEFQRIAYLDGDMLERMMRSEIQLQNKVSYIFSGSKVHLLKEMFESGDKPFFQSTKIMTIDYIPKNEFTRYIKTEFKRTKVNLSDELIEQIVDICGGHPQRTKQLCFEVWNHIALDNPVNSIEGLNKIIKMMIKNDDYLSELWSSIKSPIQRKLLIGISNESFEQPFSTDLLKKYDLESASHVQRAMKSLENQGIIQHRTIVDPFFKLWILQNAV